MQPSRNISTIDINYYISLSSIISGKDHEHMLCVFFTVPEKK